MVPRPSTVDQLTKLPMKVHPTFHISPSSRKGFDNLMVIHTKLELRLLHMADHCLFKAMELTKLASEAQSKHIPTPSIQQGEWLIQIKHGIHAQNTITRPPTVSIFTVPNILVGLKRDAYLPQAVSIGPCFHRHSHLSNMDNHKLRALQRMVNRFHGGSEINFLLKEIEKMKGEIRDSYEKVVDCNSETLAWMMVLDGSFLLELFRTLIGAKDDLPSGSTYFEPIFDENRIQSVGLAALADIVKLGNQIPLFILEKLLQTETGYEQQASDKMLFGLLVKAASTFLPLKVLHTDCLYSSEQISEILGRGHFLGFLHGLIISHFLGLAGKDKVEADSAGTVCIHVLPSVSTLSKAGICISPSEGNEEGKRGLRFDKEKCTLFLPMIIISENTEAIMRNLMALEAFLPSELQFVSCYVGLMNSLIYSQNDVSVLRMAGIIRIHAGNDAQVAQVWDNLCKGLAISSIQPLKIIKKEIMECYKSMFRTKLFEFFLARTRPWRTGVSVIAATLIFLFTLAQTLSSMYGFHT